MRHVILLSSALVLAQPAQAETTFEDGFDLLAEGTQLLLRGLLEEMEPALESMQGALSNLDAYHAPEVLPNGDIIIRRKVPLEVEPPEGEIDI